MYVTFVDYMNSFIRALLLEISVKQTKVKTKLTGQW